MALTIRKVSKRLRSRFQLRHTKLVIGSQGKWHNLDTLWAYKMKSRRLRKIAAASRRRNRQ